MARSRATAAAASGFSVSATAISPETRPSTATNMGVLPCSASRSAASPRPSSAQARSSIKRRLPINTRAPATSASMPWPGRASKTPWSTSSRPAALARSTIASPSGCSDPRSAEAASVTSRSSVIADAVGATTTSVTAGRPVVSVPVLSSTIACSLCARSSASPERMRMPFSAPLPVPTMMAVGVARPMAQGQAMMSTETKASMASVKAGDGPNTSQTTKVTAATPNTTGTKMLATKSARRWIGALDPCASSTRRMIWASAVSLPDPGGAEAEGAGLVERGPHDLVAGFLLHRQRLAGQHRLVDGRATFEHHAIDRHLLARPDDDHVVHQHVVHGQVEFQPLAHDPGRLGPRAPSAASWPRRSGPWPAPRGTCPAG